MGVFGKMENNIIDYTENIFEDIKHFDKYRNEYWKAREFYKLLDYGEYRKFKPVIEKAIIACINSKL